MRRARTDAQPALTGPDWQGRRVLEALTVLGRRRGVLLALSVSMVAAVIGLIVVTDAYRAQHDRAEALSARQEAGREATEVARAVAVRLTTYSYRSLDQDFSWVEVVGTPSFQRTFAATRTKAEQIIEATRARASGQVVDAAPRVVDQDHVTVLLFVDQTLRTRRDPRGTVDQSRLTIDMVRSGSTWRVDALSLDSSS